MNYEITGLNVVFCDGGTDIKDKERTFELLKTEKQTGRLEKNIAAGEEMIVILEWVGDNIGSSLG